jgi:hypothetical protein
MKKRQAIDIINEGSRVSGVFRLGFQQGFAIGESKMSLGRDPALKQTLPFLPEIGMIGDELFHLMSFRGRQFVVGIQQKELFIIISCDHRL